MGLCTKCETLEAAARRGLSKQQVSSAQKLRATRLAVPTESAPSPAWDSLDVQAGSVQDSGEVPWSFLYSKLIFLLCPFPFLNEPQRRRAGMQRGRGGWGRRALGTGSPAESAPSFPSCLVCREMPSPHFYNNLALLRHQLTEQWRLSLLPDTLPRMANAFLSNANSEGGSGRGGSSALFPRVCSTL